MEEKLLLKISIGCALIGLVILFWVSRNLELATNKIGEITIEDLGKNVKVCGKIASKSESKTNHVFLRLQDDTGNIDVVIFNSTAENARKLGIDPYQLKKYDSICVTGSVDEYKEKLEIIAKKIEGM
jgi:DNA/RNA endonuclease YhcR with UshA esterase domain